MSPRRLLAVASAVTRAHRGVAARSAPIAGARWMSIESDMRARDAAYESQYFHEQDVRAIKALSRKVRDAHARQEGYCADSEEIAELRKRVPETTTFSDDAIERLMTWKHDVLGNSARGGTVGA